MTKILLASVTFALSVNSFASFLSNERVHLSCNNLNQKDIKELEVIDDGLEASVTVVHYDNLGRSSFYRQSASSLDEGRLTLIPFEGLSRILVKNKDQSWSIVSFKGSKQVKVDSINCSFPVSQYQCTTIYDQGSEVFGYGPSLEDAQHDALQECYDMSYEIPGGPYDMCKMNLTCKSL